MPSRLVDLMMPAYNRWAFTEESLKNLEETTDWDQVQSFTVYDVGSSDSTRLKLNEWARESSVLARVAHLPATSVTDILTKHVMESSADFIAKIDNDTITPPGWLEKALDVMERHQELDLLGIEAHLPLEPASQYSYAPAKFIGGIGLFRRSAFEGPTMPKGHDTFFGFTEWQDQNQDIIKGWIRPSIPVCLLDRLPFEPWVSLTADYVRKGWQRSWPKYDFNHTKLWRWKWPNS